MRYTVNQGYTIQGWELGKKSYAQIWKVHLVWKQFALALDSHLKKKKNHKNSYNLHNSN